MATTFPCSLDALSALGAEGIWVFSPIVALALGAGLFAAFRRRSSGEWLLLCLTAAYGAFYLFFHKHSYYLLAILPFAAILTGRLVDGIRSNALRRLSVGAVVASGAFVSVIDVTGMKLGFSEIRRFADAFHALPEPVGRVVAEGIVVDNIGIVLDFYVPGLRSGGSRSPRSRRGTRGHPAGLGLASFPASPEDTESRASVSS